MVNGPTHDVGHILDLVFAPVLSLNSLFMSVLQPVCLHRGRRKLSLIRFGQLDFQL